MATAAPNSSIELMPRLSMKLHRSQRTKLTPVETAYTYNSYYDITIFVTCIHILVPSPTHYMHRRKKNGLMHQVQNLDYSSSEEYPINLQNDYIITLE